MQTVWTQLQINDCFRLAQVFRTGIEQCDSLKLPITFQDFPLGACGDTTLLIAKYLQHHNYGNFQYVLGKRDKKTHSWAQRDGLIVDITADQFDDNQNPVIVTTDFTWHSTFEIQDVHNADYEKYDLRTVQELGSAYHMIFAQIEKSCEYTRNIHCCEARDT
jgi:hypothetical protein